MKKYPVVCHPRYIHYSKNAESARDIPSDESRSVHH